MRRVAIAFIAACVLLLLLALGGVFSGRIPRIRYEDIDIDSSGDVRAEGVRIEGSSGEWVLNAKVAYLSKSGAMRLEEPVMRLSEEAQGTRREGREIAVRADRGRRKGKDEEGRDHPEIHLEGNVLVESRSKGETVSLRCSNLVWNDETGRVAVKGPVEIAAQMSSGRYTGSGEDAEADIRAHRIRILRSVHLVLSGGVELLPAAKPANAKSESVATHVVCRGPLDVDGLEGKISLAGPVDIARGGEKLRAQELTLFLTGDTENPIGEIVAVGDVRLAGAELSMTCDRLGSATREEIVLTGKPATLKRGQSAFEADEIRLFPAAKKLSVRGPGRLSHEPAETDADGGAVAVAWSRAMDYDPEAGQAFIVGDVHVTRGGGDITCGRLVLTLDAETGGIKSMVAQKGVRAQTGEGEALGDVLTYDATGDHLTLEGQPQAKLTREDGVIAAPKIHLKQTKGVIRCEGAGYLELAAGEDADAQPKKIIWLKSMSYADKEGRASFAGEVHLGIGDFRLDADDVEVRFTEEREVKALGCTGEGTLTVKASASADGQAPAERRIRWRKQMTYDSGERTAEFRGTVRLVDGGQTLEAEALDVAFTPEHELQALSCPGSGKLVAVVKDEKAGSGKRSIGWKGSMRFDRASGAAVFRDDVAYEAADYTLRADVVKTTISESGELKAVGGEGDVRLDAEKTKVFADGFRYDAATGSGEMTGNPVRAWHEGGWLKCRRVIFREGLRDVIFTGQVEGAVTNEKQ